MASLHLSILRGQALYEFINVARPPRHPSVARPKKKKKKPGAESAVATNRSNYRVLFDLLCGMSVANCSLSTLARPLNGTQLSNPGKVGLNTAG